MINRLKILSETEEFAKYVMKIKSLINKSLFSRNLILIDVWSHRMLTIRGNQTGITIQSHKIGNKS